MICKSCNEEFNDGLKFCPNCGQLVEEVAEEVKAEEQQEEQQQQEVVKEEATASVPVVEEKKKNYRLIGIVSSIVAVALVIFLIFGVFGRTSNSVVKKYMKSLNKFDFKKAASLSPIDMEKLTIKSSGLSEKEFNKKLEEEFKKAKEEDEEQYKGFNIKSMKDIFKFSSKKMKEFYEEEFGKGYKISFKILETTKLSKEEVQKNVDKLKNELSNVNLSDFMKIDKVSHMNRYKIEVTVKSKDKDDTTYENELYTAKIAGKWCMWPDSSVRSVGSGNASGMIN